MDRSSFTIEFAPEVVDHLKAIDRKFHSAIRDGIDKHLHHEPTLETRNRKPLRQPAPHDATWELRIGDGNRFRVFYEVDEALRIVSILAIGTKDGNRLHIGSEEIEL